jgi:hypothetical protein
MAPIASKERFIRLGGQPGLLIGFCRILNRCAPGFARRVSLKDPM